MRVVKARNIFAHKETIPERYSFATVIKLVSRKARRLCFFYYVEMSTEKVGTKRQRQRGEYAKRKVYGPYPSFLKKLEFTLLFS